MKQATLNLNLNLKKTRKREFLEQMEQVVPWVALVELIAPYYPEGRTGRPPFSLLTMLRIHFMQQWFTLSDPGMEEAFFDTPLYREFANLEEFSRLPDESTILRFRHRLEKHKLAEQMLLTVNELLTQRGLLLKAGTAVDATLIAAPTSTKNKDKKRDPDMHQVKKGNQWHFGMKVHIGADSKTGLVHSASVTAANVHDSHEVPNLLHGAETRFYGDSAYRGKAQREKLRELAPRAKDFTNKRAYRNSPLTDADLEANRRKSSVRSKVEHPFLTLKRLWGFAKVRYRGLAKNANRAFAMLALINLVKWGRPLTGEVRPA